MKKLFCIILAVLIFLPACSGSEENSITDHIAYKTFNELAEGYKGENIADYRVIGAIVGGNVSLVGYGFAPDEPKDDAVSNGEYLLSLYFAKKGGLDISKYDTEKSVEVMKNAVSDCDKLSAYEVFLCVASLELYNANYDKASVVESLKSRQHQISGGFYDYVQTAGSESKCEIPASAYAHLCYVMLKQNVKGLDFDNSLMYLGNSIGEDNTLNDADGKSSSKATALALTAILASGVNGTGEISTKLHTAMTLFKDGGIYREYKGAQKGDLVDNYVIFCASSAMFGNPITLAK